MSLTITKDDWTTDNLSAVLQGWQSQEYKYLVEEPASASGAMNFGTEKNPLS
ncbi:hypothetical protein PCASD_13545 [Puccinia coronata f. sp. avenae]|uniref:Uncharacterized protein n=1 Tax=Puccinia coronata f. sp. avenae TaxID=200324 RepID=A0A2N5TDU4_9BASI|nr:hypothetical protein PCASD_13545 [Puccinia coronata f. sp. avenae]